MKRAMVWILSVVLLCGCSNKSSHLDRALAMREQLLKSEGCSFDAVVTADYGENTYTFKMHCTSDGSGNVSFEVLEPESISAITGTISEEDGKLTFDDQVLAFATMADGQITPVSAPWVLIRTLRGGYLNACTSWDDGLQLLIDDSYRDDALQLDIKTNAQDHPVWAEILWKGRRVLSLSIDNFIIM